MNRLFVILLMLFSIQLMAQNPCQDGTIFIDGNETDAISFENSNTSGLKLPLWLDAGSTLAAGTRVQFISVIEFNIDNSTGNNTLVFNQVKKVSSQTETVPNDKVWKIESIVKFSNAFSTGFTATSSGTVCVGDTIYLNSTGPQGTVYSWTGPNNFNSNQQNPIIPNATLAAAGTYSLTATLNGCTSNPVATTVTVNSIPSSAFSWSPQTPNIGQGASFTPSATGVSYAWTFSNGNPSGSSNQSPTVIWSTAGKFEVLLTTSQNGCSSTQKDSIEVVTQTCTPLHTITYNFNSGASSTSTQCNQWTAFRSSLTPGVYCSMTLEGSQYPQGYTCNDPVIVNQLATLLKNGSNGMVTTCNGMIWEVDFNDWLYVDNTGGGSCDMTACLRPCILNPNWGGFNTQICNGPTQSITLTFNH